jgi:hypothetical protein
VAGFVLMSAKDLREEATHLARVIAKLGARFGKEQSMYGKGWWIILLWPAWCVILLFVMSLIAGIAGKFDWEDGYKGVPQITGFVVGWFVASSWYKAKYTKEKPVTSSLAGVIFCVVCTTAAASLFGLKMI